MPEETCAFLQREYTNKERRFCEKLGTNVLNLMKKHCEVHKSFNEKTLREKMQIL